MWKPAPITTGQVYGACSGWQAYSGSQVCGGVMPLTAWAATPTRANGVGRKEPRLFGVPGVMTLLREGRGDFLPTTPLSVAYPLSADNISRPLPIRLKGVNQPVIRT